jgi:predicted RNA binding protein YcfA (HicA-like mRNA interferase family)
MPGIPVLKPREVISILLVLGFAEVRQRGSHKQFRHADGRSTTVPRFTLAATSRRSCCAKSPGTSA